MHEKMKFVVNITKIEFFLIYHSVIQRNHWRVGKSRMRSTDVRKIMQFLKHADIQYISTISKLLQAAAKLIIINSCICSQLVVQSRTTDHDNTENGKNSVLL